MGTFLFRSQARRRPKALIPEVLRADCSAAAVFVLNTRIRSVHVEYRLYLPRLEAIADPWLGENVLRGWTIGLKFLAQMVHEHAKVFRLFGTVAAPNSRKQNAVRKNLARMLRQVGQQ